MKPAIERRFLCFLLALVAAVLVAGCSSSGGQDAGADDSDAEGMRDLAATQQAEAPMDRQQADDVALSETAPDESVDRKLIAKGNVSLESEDVAATVDDVQEVTDEYFGEISERETSTNEDGEVRHARLLLRIPVDDFTVALADLEEVADLESSSSGAEDVTTQVIDTQVRIRAQRRSLLRVEALLDRAQSIGDIIRIEAQLTRRQADLDSLQQRLDYLTNQTSMSTITVNISLPPEEEKEEEPEEAGFLAGLDDGWDALQTFGTAAATLAGRVLPFAAVLILLGAPVWLVLRRRTRRSPTASPASPV